MQIIIGILIPFLGTTLGALLVFLLRGKLNAKIEKTIFEYINIYFEVNNHTSRDRLLT